MSITFKDVAVLWEADKKQYVKKSTYASYALLLRVHILPVFAEREDVLEEEVQTFVNEKFASGLSRKTVQDMVVVLRMVLRYGAKHGYWSLHPIDIVFPTGGGKREIQVLPLGQQRLLMAHVRENFTFRNLGILICLSTGLRIGEVCGLQWNDIDTDLGVVRVCRTVQRIYTGGGSGGHTELFIGKPKTVSSAREIPMTRGLLSMVRPLKKVVRGDFFVVTNDSAPVEPRTYRCYFNRLLEKLHLKKIRFHGLRHSFATRCIEGKCDYKTVSVLLGHANISTTLNLYVHPDIEQKKRCIGAFEKYVKCSDE